MLTPAIAVRLAVICGSFALASVVQGQDVMLVPCGQVSFFTPRCVVLELATPPPVPPAPPVEPLFPPGTMAQDTPPLMMKLLHEPTVENARAFLDWQALRQARVQEVQQLLRLMQRRAPRPESD